VLGRQPLVGGFTEAHFSRAFEASEARPAIVSHAFWTEHLRGDPSAIGRTAGLLVSFWAARLLSAFLYEVDEHEPLVWALATLTLIVVTGIAAWIPARRASSVDAMRVLRAE
jgi:hypothetical protein